MAQIQCIHLHDTVAPPADGEPLLVKIPAGCLILSTQKHNDRVSMWAIANPQAPIIEVRIHRVYDFTDLTVPPPPMASHLASIQDGGLMVHYFLEQPRVSQIVRP
jgi:hypothetical protein